MHEKITLHYEIKEKFIPSVIVNIMEKRELLVVVEVLNRVATPHYCYKDSDGKLYVKKCIGMDEVTCIDIKEVK